MSNTQSSPQRTMNGRPLVELLGEKHPEYFDKIWLDHDGTLTFGDKVYILNDLGPELGLDIAPLIEDGILD